MISHCVKFEFDQSMKLTKRLVPINLKHIIQLLKQISSFFALSDFFLVRKIVQCAGLNEPFTICHLSTCLSAIFGIKDQRSGLVEQKLGKNVLYRVIKIMTLQTFMKNLNNCYYFDLFFYHNVNG